MKSSISKRRVWVVFDFPVLMHRERYIGNIKTCNCGFQLINCFQDIWLDLFFWKSLLTLL